MAQWHIQFIININVQSCYGLFKWHCSSNHICHIRDVDAQHWEKAWLHFKSLDWNCCRAFTAQHTNISLSPSCNWFKQNVFTNSNKIKVFMYVQCSLEADWSRRRMTNTHTFALILVSFSYWGKNTSHFSPFIQLFYVHI